MTEAISYGSGGTYGDTPYSDIAHADTYHSDIAHSDQTVVTSPHTDSPAASHLDHSDTGLIYADIPAKHADVVPLGSIDVEFSPGGMKPDMASFIYKSGQSQKNVSKKYTIANNARSLLRVTFSNIPSGITVDPMDFTVNPETSKPFTVTVTQDYTNTLSAGTTQKNIIITLQLIG